MAITDNCEGFVQHASPYSTPPTYAAATIYKFGRYVDGNKRILDTDLKTEIYEQGRMGVHFPTLSGGNLPADSIAATFGAVNGLWAYQFFGKATIVGADSDTSVKTVVPFTTARKPRVGIFKKRADLQHHCNGVIFSDISGSFKPGALIINMAGKGLDWSTNSYVPTAEAFPKDKNSVEIDSLFNVMSTFSIQPSGGDLINLTLIENSFSFQGKQNLFMSPGSNGYYSELSEFGNRFNMVFSFQAIADHGEALEPTRLAQTTCSFIWKVVKADDTNQYIQFTQNVKILTCIETSNLGEPNVYTVNLLSESPSIAIVDKLIHSWYGG